MVVEQVVVSMNTAMIHLFPKADFCIVRELNNLRSSAPHFLGFVARIFQRGNTGHCIFGKPALLNCRHYRIGPEGKVFGFHE